MLRSRLYIGMLPVAGLLILVCLYSVYNHNKLSSQLDNLQLDHYSAIAALDRVLLATSQIERSIRLNQRGDAELAGRAFERSLPVLKDWVEAKRDVVATEAESDLPQLIRNLVSLAESVMRSSAKIDLTMLRPLVERIEEESLRTIAKHNSAISARNDLLRADSRVHFYVVVSAIVSSVFLMGLVAYVLSQRILAPIDALAESAARIGGDNWDTTDYVPSSKDEIGRLETAFVEMAGRIREYQRITNKKMLRTRRRMEECFNNLPNPVLFLNANRTIAYRNPAAKELLRIVSWKEALLPLLEGRIERVFGTGAEIVETDFEESVSVKIENEMRHFLPIFVRVDSEEIDEIECGLVLQDITQLRLSDELKSDLVATVSHEIKTPVTSATMAIHLLLEKGLGELTEDQEDMLETANSDLNRLRRLLDHFLEIARLERNAPELDYTIETPLRIISLVMDGFSMAAQARDVQLVAAVEEGLPSVSVDVKAIEVGLSNYVSNAIKYSPVGSRVEVYARLSGDRVRFGVKDEGPGIVKEDIHKVFDKFYRSTKHRKMEGVGLGLSIVKDIALAHGGSAGCEVREPVGCDFYIDIDSAVAAE